MGNKNQKVINKIPIPRLSRASNTKLESCMLTRRELEIAILVAMGEINKQIAEHLDISEWTVSTHLRRIFTKLSVKSRAAMIYRCSGYIEAFINENPSHSFNRFIQP